MEELVIGLIVTVGGSLINFLSTLIYNYFTGKSKNFLWKNRFEDLRTLKHTADFEELKKRTRIVVIDDDDVFPLKLFKEHGYSVDKWDIVEDYTKLEHGFYDIIILDIKGVAQHISLEDGLGVLTSLKKNNPSQIIISFSQYSYALDKVQFFQQADENIAKPSDFLKIKKILDNLISTQFKPDRYINALNKILKNNNILERDIRKINLQISKAIINKKIPDWNDIFCGVKNKPELVIQLTNIGETITKFYK
jgi:CheY-like chemotaxis protein